jgi:hypothetical protein
MKMEKIIEQQIESLKAQVKQAKADELGYAYAYLTGKLAAYEDMLEEIKYNQ